MRLVRKANRNYKQEKDNGQMELLSGLELVRSERERDVFDILQIAQVFVFCCLPYRPTEETQLVRTARLGDGSIVEVTFAALRKGVPIAYGNDRSLLYWLIDRAIQENTARVTWQHASEYLKATGQGDGGRNGTLLRQRFERIASTAISVVRKSAALGSEQMNMPIVRRMTLPPSIVGDEKGTSKLQARRQGVPFGLQFDDDFVKDFMMHKVPILRSLLVATHARPQMQDCMFFLIWRSYSAAKDSFVEWDKLRDQFWQADSNQSRIRLRFREAITLIRSAWPELEAEARSRGLWIGPPKNGTQFIPQLRPPKHVALLEEKKQRLERRTRLEKTIKQLCLKPGTRGF